MKPNILTLLLCAVFPAISSYSQVSTIIRSCDELFWNDKAECLSKSPIEGFPRFREFFREIPMEKGDDWIKFFEIDSDRRDKNYSIQWKLIDSTLYLNDIYFYTLKDPKKDLPLFFVDENEPYRRMEKYINQKFDQRSPVGRVKPISTYGVIAATWFSGSILIKAPFPSGNITFDKWLHYPFIKLTFLSGKLTEVENLGDLNAK